MCRDLKKSPPDDREDQNKTSEPEAYLTARRQVPTLSFILLTHATLAHIGAFAHCCKHFPLFTRVPIYATTPVISLGRTLLQDLYSSTPLASTAIPEAALSESTYTIPTNTSGKRQDILLQPPTAEEITGYFSLVNQLRYSQPHQPLSSPFSPPLGGLTITAFGAGHSLGGTIWHIQHGLESIVYAVDWNQARENVLPGAAWLSGAATGGAEIVEQLKRPTAMVCSSRGTETLQSSGQQKKKDALLLELIRNTVGRGGSVLIPTDSSARVLELAYILERAWAAEDGLRLKARLHLASRSCGATMRHARSMLEWMEEGIVREFETASVAHGGGHSGGRQRQQGADGREDSRPSRAPFDFQYMHMVERVKNFNKVLQSDGSKVILASDSSMEWGFSGDALRKMAADSKNLIVLTERSGTTSADSGCLGRFLWDLWFEKAKDNANTRGTSIIVDSDGAEAIARSARTEPLTGTEISLYQQYLARQRQLQNTLQADKNLSLETSADVIDDRSDSSSDSSDDSDVEHQGKAMNVSTALNHSRHRLELTDAELGVNILIRRKNVHDYDVRGKKGRERIFPFVAKRRRADDFGDLIRPEDYLRAEERDQVDGEDMRDGLGPPGAPGPGKANVVGQKRKWDDVAARRSAGAYDKKLKQADGKDGARGAKKRAGADGVGQGAPADESDSDSDSDSDALTAGSGPLKLITTTETLTFHCQLAFVDFAGLHDRRSLQVLIPFIRPRKLIFVGGSASETIALANDCRKVLAAPSAVDGGGGGGGDAAEVFTPAVDELVDASVDTNAWAVRLSAPLARRLQWQKVRGLGVVAVTGRLEAPAPPDPDSAESGTSPAGGRRAAKKPKTSTAAAGEGAPEPEAPEAAPPPGPPTLDVLPPSLLSAARAAVSQQPLHVGDLRLADLRRLMQAEGLGAEFRGEGTLLVDGRVVVRKSGTGRIEVEGAAGAAGTGGGGSARGAGGEVFRAVRRKIYEGLAVVAGG